MLEIHVNGFTVIAHEFTPHRGYVILGARRTGPGSYEYVVAELASLDDKSWPSGTYFSTISAATTEYTNRKGI